MDKYLMALDQGTTSSRCIIFDKSGNIISVAQKEFRQIFPNPGWVEHDPMEIYSSQRAVMAEAMSFADLKSSDIDSIGITNQRETTILWDKNTGKPVYNAIVWQCRRTAGIIDSLKNDAKSIQEKTGLIPDAYFSATKIKWILDNVEGVRQRAQKGEILFGTVDTWLVWNLTGRKVHVTDYTNASRTMLYNIHTLEWDKDILNLLDIPENILPKVMPSSYVYGSTDPEITGGAIKIAGMAGDQQAALFGQCCFNEGDVKNTYGTGCFLLMNTGERAVYSKEGLLTTIAIGMEDRIEYALEGSVFVAGATIQWLRDELKLIETAAQSEEYCRQVEDTAGVYLVPAFTGLGAPYWDQYARGSIIGLTRGSKKAHIIRAAVESLAYQVLDLIKAMEKTSSIKLSELKVDGGASANDFLMQFQADILNAAVKRPKCIETTALGASYLAGLATGYYKSKEDIKKNWMLQREFKPEMEEKNREKIVSGWHKAVKRSLHWEEEV